MPKNIDLYKKYAHKHLAHKPRAYGDSYYDHSLRLYDTLVNFKITSDDILNAALIHDVEHCTSDHAKNLNFSPTVIELNKAYNKFKKIHIQSNKLSNEAYAIQTYINASDDMRALTLRLFERLDNIKTAVALEPDKRIDTAARAVSFYSPLAKMLGLGKLSTLLEDNGFKILDPFQYHKINTEINTEKDYLRITMDDVIQFVKAILEENNIKCDMYYRLKGIYSIYKKISYRNAKPDDLVAARILVNTTEECYIVEDILKSIWQNYPELRDDYISTPRKSGYQSLHNIFRISHNLNIEIQIRTHKMHEYNEYGPASHLLYKLGDKGTTSAAYDKFIKYTKQDNFWFKDLNIGELALDTKTVKVITPFSKYIYVFTPKGDIVQLPFGACIVDFAYELHTDMGNHCCGGYVNNHYVSLSHKLKTGDYVRIERQKKINANIDWLGFVKTRKAKSEIRKLLP